MDILLISIVIVLIFGVTLGRIFDKRFAFSNLSSVANETDDCRNLAFALNPCRDIIGSSLDCLSSFDDLAVCKNHRQACQTLRTVEQRLNRDSQCHAYQSYMLKAAEKVAETSRHIITTPGSSLPTGSKCEIQSIRQSLDHIFQSADKALSSDTSTTQIINDIDREKDFIEHTMAMHTKGMPPHGYADGTTSYYYLRLLSYLHSVLSSLAMALRPRSAPQLQT